MTKDPDRPRPDLDRWPDENARLAPSLRGVAPPDALRLRRTRALDRRLRIVGWSLAAALLALPLVAMPFTGEVAWTAFDFVFAGVMLGAVGLLIELTFRFSADWAYRGGVAAALAGGFLTVWINGAVGIIGDEGHPANMMFSWVLAVGMIGAVLARFRARGMAWAMVVTAVAQAAVGVIALLMHLPFPGPITLFFMAFWLTSAALFRKAAGGAPRAAAAP